MKNRYVIEVKHKGDWVRSLNASSISGKDLDTVTFSEEAALREVEYQKSANGMEYRYVLSAASYVLSGASQVAQKAEEEQEKFNGLVIQSLELLTDLLAQAGQRLGKLEAEPVPTPSLVETPTRTVLALERIADVLEARLPYSLVYGQSPNWSPNWISYPNSPIAPTVTYNSGPTEPKDYTARLDTGWQTP